MSSIGTPIGTPATIDSRVSSAPVAAFATKTSVEVPPISNPIILSNPAHCAIRHAPTTPPAGPLSTVRTGSSAATRAAIIPPDDCITSTRPFLCFSAIRFSKANKYCSIRGARYAFTTVVDARSYSRNSGKIRCDAETGIPSSRNAASTRRSVFGFAKANSKLIATASAPLAFTPSTSAASSASVGSRRISPSALTRSATPKSQFSRHQANRHRRKPVVESRPRLPPDRDGIFKPRRRHKRDARPSPLEHCVRAHCRSVPHFDIFRAAQLPHAFQHRP